MVESILTYISRRVNQKSPAGLEKKPPRCYYIAEIASAAYEKDGKKELVKYLPFLDEDDVKKFADIEFGKSGIKGLATFIPFLDEDDVRKFAEKIIKK